MDIKELRTQIGMTQSEFARHFHMNIDTLRAWEQGVNRIPEHIMWMVHRILELEGRLDESMSYENSGSRSGGKLLFNKAQLDEVKAMVIRGRTKGAIAQHFGVSTNTIYKLCKEHDFQPDYRYTHKCILCGVEFRSGLEHAIFCNHEFKKILDAVDFNDYQKVEAVTDKLFEFSRFCGYIETPSELDNIVAQERDSCKCVSNGDMYWYKCGQWHSLFDMDEEIFGWKLKFRDAQNILGKYSNAMDN